MARTKLPMPDAYKYHTQVRVRISDVNYGNHLGNDAVLALVHEARLRFLAEYGFSEISVGEGVGLIMADVTVVFKSQARHGDRLTIDVLPVEPENFGFDMYYRISNAETGHEVAQIKSSMICFDYAKNKPARMPEGLKIIF